MTIGGVGSKLHFIINNAIYGGPRPADVREPSDTKQPGDTEQPGDTKQPGDTAQPDQATQSDDVSSPGEPGKAGEPGKPGEPGEPGKPDLPKEPKPPAEPADDRESFGGDLPDIEPPKRAKRRAKGRAARKKARRPTQREIDQPEHKETVTKKPSKEETIDSLTEELKGLNWFDRNFAKYINPSLTLSLSQAKAQGHSKGVTTDSPEMETALNTLMPFFELDFGMFGRDFVLYSSLEEVTGVNPDGTVEPGFKEPSYTGVRLTPDLNVNYKKNYSIKEDDYSWDLAAGLSLFVDTEDFSLETYGDFEIGETNREWTSPAFPSGLMLEGGGGLAPSFHLKWFDIRVYAEGLAQRLEGYYNWGRNVDISREANRINFGTELTYHQLQTYHSPYAPNFDVKYQAIVYGTEEEKIDEETQERDLSGWTVGGGLQFGEKVGNLGLHFEYSKEILGKDLTDVSLFKFIGSGDIPYAGNLALTAGYGKGLEHRCDIDTIGFFDWRITSGDFLSPVAGPARFHWGFKGTVAVQQDNLRPGQPEYIQYGFAVFVGLSFINRQLMLAHQLEALLEKQESASSDDDE